MARARNIKPAFFTNEELGTLDPIINLTFIGLWCLADKEGILEDRPLRIKAELFPYRDSLDINGYLTVLTQLNFIERYEVNGKCYIHITNFEKHQSPHHTEKAKGYPKKPNKINKARALTVKSPLHNQDLTVPTRSDSLIPDSLIPDSLIPDSNAIGDSFESPKPHSSKNKNKSDSIGRRFTENDLLKPEWIAYCNSVRPDLDPKSVFEDFRCHWLSKAGADARKTNWDLTWQGWVRRQHAKVKTKHDQGNEAFHQLTGGMLKPKQNDAVFQSIAQTIDMESDHASLR